MRFFVFTGLLLLGACAADQVRLEAASSLSVQAKATVAAGRSYATDVQLRRREAAVALVASDPSCSWGQTLIIDRHWDGKTGLCDLTGVPVERQQSIDLRPISQEGLKALTAAIAGIAAYQGALADILDGKPEDAKETIATAIETLTTASADINRIAGEKLLDLGPLGSDSANAVVSLIGTLIELQQTNLKVSRVRAVVARTESVALIGAVEQALGRLNTLQDSNSAVMRGFALNIVYDRDRSTLDFTNRLQRVRDLAIASDDITEGQKKRVEALTAALKGLAECDTKLRNTLAGKFTPEERKRIARENRKQLFSILSQVAAIFPPL